MKTATIGIIGATGKTGGRVKARLEHLGYTPRALSRQAMPGFDWDKPQDWAAALEGLGSVYVTYQPDLAVPRAEKDIEQLVAVAKEAGIKHMVLLSGRGEEGAQKAEKVVINSGLDWNIVRAGWFMQNFSESFMLDGILARQLVLPEPKAKEPFIDVDDIADVVIAALTRDELQNNEFEITGPEILSFEDCVRIIGKAIGEPIQFQPIPVEDYLSAATAAGMPEDIAWLIRELFTAVLDGTNEWTTNTIEEVLGRPARTFEDYVKSTAESGVWNTTTVEEVD